MMWLFFALGCSLGNPSVGACDTHGQCAEAFGFASVCGGDGFCTDAGLPSGCGRTRPADLFDDLDAYRDVTPVGSLLHRDVDPSAWEGAETAFFQVSAAGGLRGAPVAVLECELDAVDALTDELGVAALLAPTNDLQAAVDAVAGRAVLMTGADRTDAFVELDPAGPTDDSPGLVWRSVPAHSTQATALATAVAGAGITSVSVLADPGTDALVTEVLAALGAGIDVQEVSAASDALAADAIVLVPSDPPGAVATLDALDAAGWDQTPVFTTSMGVHPDVPTTVAGGARLLPAVRGTAPPSRLEAASFEDYWRTVGALTGNDRLPTDADALASFDAAWLLMNGVAWATRPEVQAGPHEVARGLRRLSAGSPFSARGQDWPDIVATFDYLDEGIDLSGASGELDFDPETEELPGEWQLWHYVGDELVAEDAP